jgi:hypothetical protein
VKEMTLLVQDGQWMGLLPAISRLAIGAEIFTILANLSFRSDQKVAPSVLSLVPETCGVSLRVCRPAVTQWGKTTSTGFVKCIDCTTWKPARRKPLIVMEVHGLTKGPSSG